MSIVRFSCAQSFHKEALVIRHLSSRTSNYTTLEKTSSFFEKVINSLLPSLSLPKNTCQFIAVVPGFHPSTPFLHALSKLGDVGVIVKNSTSHLTSNRRAWQAAGCHVYKGISKDLLAKPNEAVAFLAQDAFVQKKKIILDHGGYFATVAPLLGKEFGDSLLGIVEYADNGVFKYLKHPSKKLPPVISTATSPLKAASDFAAGEAITFALDYLTRESFAKRLGDHATIGIIGYGRMGASIIDNLKPLSSSRLLVHDIDPYKMTMSSVKHAIPSSLERLLAESDFIISASGTGQAIKSNHYALLKDNACLATVTSPDDELALQALIKKGTLISKETLGHFKAYATGNKTIYLALNGESPNTFIASGVAHPSIHLPFAEYLSAAASLASGERFPAGVSELPSLTQKKIAHIWLDHFYETTSRD